MPYRLLAIDLDGTLLDRNGRVSAANVRAIERALSAGVRIVPCTGRGWRESHIALQHLPPLDAGVFIGGAVINRISDGQSLDLAVLEPHIAMKVALALWNLPEPILAFCDESLAGHQYLVAGSGTLSASTQWWFETTGASVKFRDQLHLDDMHHVLRMGVVATAPQMPKIEKIVEQAVGGDVYMHSFEAVQKPDSSASEHILEIFAHGVDKWRGLQWLAEQHEIPQQEIAAIGDQINDMAMIKSAGCGIAMGNAIKPLRDAARYVSRDCDEDGVAYAIDQLLEGRWQ